MKDTTTYINLTGLFDEFGTRLTASVLVIGGV